MGIDIPFNVIARFGSEERDIRENTFGGVYAMLPSVDEEDYNKTLFKSNDGGDTKKGNNWWFVVIGVIMILSIIIYLIISKNKK